MVEISHTNLRAANIARQQEWDAGNQITLAYRGNELAGEVGEACNAIKKLERERMGIAGSRDTIEHLAEELADVVICADLIAMQAGVDLDAAVEAKFNATSEEVGLATRYRRAEARQAPRLTRDLVSLVIAAREFWDVHNDLSEESIALDKALDRFSEQIPYENGPSAPLPAETVTEAWSYTINYGPDGEENYAYVYTPDGEFVGNLKIHHARAIVGGLNEAALAARPCNSRQDGDASDAEMGAACRKFNIGTPARLDAIMARLRAAEAARPAEPVAVKGLRWEQPDGHGETHSWLGHGTDYCQYYIRWDSNGAWVIPGDADEPDAYATIDEAKAAAQADYEQRIRSALVSTPAPGLVEAPTHVRPEVKSEIEILERLAAGDAIAFSQDGDAAFFVNGDRAFVGRVLLTMRSKGYIKRVVLDDENYRGLSERDVISDAGRAALSSITETGGAKE